jgi:hypothetical protein
VVWSLFLETDSEGPAFISRTASVTISQFIVNLLLVRACGALSMPQCWRIAAPAVVADSLIWQA